MSRRLSLHDRDRNSSFSPAPKGKFKLPDHRSTIPGWSQVDAAPIILPIKGVSEAATEAREVTREYLTVDLLASSHFPLCFSWNVGLVEARLILEVSPRINGLQSITQNDLVEIVLGFLHQPSSTVT